MPPREDVRGPDRDDLSQGREVLPYSWKGPSLKFMTSSLEARHLWQLALWQSVRLGNFG
jgi:hypothetical protein